MPFAIGILDAYSVVDRASGRSYCSSGVAHSTGALRHTQPPNSALRNNLALEVPRCIHENRLNTFLALSFALPCILWISSSLVFWNSS